MSVDEKMQQILDRITISHAEEIRGNIFLPTQLKNARITWESSNPGIISDQKIGDMEPGVVKRGERDEKVLLIAHVSMQDVKADKTIEVCVKAAPKDITEEDYAGYLFAHFIGEQTEMQEQIYFALSENGLHFKDLHHRLPVLYSTVGEKGVRDPYLCRSKEGDRFFLIATDLSIYNRGGWKKNEQGYYDASTTGSSYLVLWESTDLVHWDEPRLVKVAPQDAGMAWAPEMIYHDETGEYIIFFASSIMNPQTKYKAKPNAIYYVATRDFIHFSEPKLFLDNQTDGETDGTKREIIDTTLLKIGDYYFSASKDGDNGEVNGGIRVMKSKELLNPDAWEKVLDLDELILDTKSMGIARLDNGLLEGPELFQYNKKDWNNPDVPEYGLMADQYATDGGYLPLKTTDIMDTTNANRSWKLLDKTEYSFDELKKRHGTIFRITEQELARLKEAFFET